MSSFNCCFLTCIEISQEAGQVVWYSHLLKNFPVCCDPHKGFGIVKSASGSSGKESTCQCRRYKKCGFNPWVRKILWRSKWQPTPVLLPGKSHGWRSLVDYSLWGRKESDTTERLHFHFTDLGFFCFEMFCSSIQYDGLFKKLFWSLLSHRQVVRVKASHDLCRIVACE